ncbi:Mitochondrial distribution and morphology protein 10 [Rhodotorula kratochvilovae]
MSQQAAYLLREFYRATHWNEWDNHYASFTHPSRQLLDFAIPTGLLLSTSSRPTLGLTPGLVLSSLVPEAVPSYPPTPAPVLGPPGTALLAGQLSYLYSSAPVLPTSSRRAEEGDARIRFKDVVGSFPLGSTPVKPELREDALPTWMGGNRVDRADYLLYGRLYAPSPRLDALYVHRLAPSLQALVSLITVPSPAPAPTLSWESTDPSASLSASATSSASAPTATSGPLARLSELELKLQQDTGRWSAEYSYAVGDGMWGVRGLYNFGRWGAPCGGSADAAAGERARERAVDEEEDEMPNGLKGRWSAGGEIYFSAQERSAGVSTGVRFATVPESAGGPPQPPTYITATLNPIMGQLSTAYAVQVGRDASLASRFDFNLYSYDADLAVGGEWFHRRAPAKALAAEEEPLHVATFDAFGRGADDEETQRRKRNNDAEDEVLGVLKVRASTSSMVALLWEGRLGDFLLSAGLVADIRQATLSRGRTSPIRSVGLSVSYWA